MKNTYVNVYVTYGTRKGHPGCVWGVWDPFGRVWMSLDASGKNKQISYASYTCMDNG